MDATVRLDDLRLPPGNRLKELSGNRAGTWSVRVNDQWRITFKFQNGEFSDVLIEDYH
jgi:proteic killer suppression protein